MTYVKMIVNGKLMYLIRSTGHYDYELTSDKKQASEFLSEAAAETYISKFSNKGSMLIVVE